MARPRNISPTPKKDISGLRQLIRGPAKVWTSLVTAHFGARTPKVQQTLEGITTKRIIFRLFWTAFFSEIFRRGEGGQGASIFIEQVVISQYSDKRDTNKMKPDVRVRPWVLRRVL